MSSPVSLFACDKCGRDFSGAKDGWERRAVHLKEGCVGRGRAVLRSQESRKERRLYLPKRQKSAPSSFWSGKRIATPLRTRPALVPPQINSYEDLRSQSEQIHAYLRFNQDPDFQNLSKEGLVSAVLECQDQELVKCVESVFHQYELCCIRRKIPQYPINGLKVALFLAEFLDYSTSHLSHIVFASNPAANQDDIASRTCARVDISTLKHLISILQSCAIATCFELGSNGKYVYAPRAAEILPNHSAVVAVLGEAKSQAAGEVLASLRSNRLLPSGGGITLHQSSSLTPPSLDQNVSTPSRIMSPPVCVVRPSPPSSVAETVSKRKRKFSDLPSPTIEPSLPCHIPSHPSHIASPRVTSGTVTIANDLYNFPAWPREGRLPSPSQLLAGVAWCPPGTTHNLPREIPGPPLVFSQLMGLQRGIGGGTPIFRASSVTCTSPDQLPLPSSA